MDMEGPRGVRQLLLPGHEASLSVFRDFLVSQHAEEGLDLVDACQKAGSAPSLDAVKTIFGEFISSDAPRDAGVAEHLRDRLEQELAAGDELEARKTLALIADEQVLRLEIDKFSAFSGSGFGKLMAKQVRENNTTISWQCLASR